MLGINKLILKIIAIVLGIIVGGVVIICVATVAGCAPNTGTDLKQNQMALATKNNIDSSQEDNRQDNSIELALPEVLGQALPPTDSNADQAVKLVKARSLEREKVLLAEGRVKEMEIRASEEKWRLLVWVLGIGAIIICVLALLVRSPVDWKDKS